jgi:toxin ParE1/3/4
MKLHYRFTPQAERSFHAISEYSKANFGSRRGQKYMSDMLVVCGKIADGLAHTSACRDIFAAGLRADLRFTRAGSHYVVFVETPTGPLILDFLHQSADLTRRLKGPS